MCLMTVPEVAKLMRVTDRTVRGWAKTGRLQSYQAGRRLLFPVDQFAGMSPAIQATVESIRSDAEALDPSLGKQEELDLTGEDLLS